MITALTPVAIFAPLTLIGMAFAQQVAALSTALQANPDLFNLSSWLDPARSIRASRGLPHGSARGSTCTTAELGSRHALPACSTWATALAKSSGQLFLGTAGVILRFFLMLFILFFMLRDGSLWFARFTALLPLAPGRRDALFTRLGKVLRAVVYGCGLTALVQGTLVASASRSPACPGPWCSACWPRILALLPFGGAALVWVPGVAVSACLRQIGWAIFLLAWGGVVSISDNFIRPMIISRYTPVPTLLVFLGVIGGVGAFGPIGFIVGAGDTGACNRIAALRGRVAHAQRLIEWA